MTETAAIQLREGDSVAVAVRPLTEGETIEIGGRSVTARRQIPAGHKIAVTDVAGDAPVIKYGVTIGYAIGPVESGDHVHIHNLALPAAAGDRQSPRRLPGSQLLIDRGLELPAQSHHDDARPGSRYSGGSLRW